MCSFRTGLPGAHWRVKLACALVSSINKPYWTNFELLQAAHRCIPHTLFLSHAPCTVAADLRAQG